MTKPHKLIDGKRVDLTDDEVHEFENSQKKWHIYKDKKDILRQIMALENSITPRRLREGCLNNLGITWLSSIDKQIADLRSKL